MRHFQKKRRLLVAVMLLMFCFSLMAAMAMAQGSTPEKPQRVCEERGQMCPPAQAPGQGLCVVGRECPPVQCPSVGVCQPSSDCPATGPVQPGKEQKNP
jgi:hypothetical protein